MAARTTPVLHPSVMSPLESGDRLTRPQAADRAHYPANWAAISGPPSLCPTTSGPVATNYLLAEFRRNYTGPASGQTDPAANRGRSPLGPQ